MPNKNFTHLLAVKSPVVLCNTITGSGALMNAPAPKKDNDDECVRNLLLLFVLAF